MVWQWNKRKPTAHCIGEWRRVRHSCRSWVCMARQKVGGLSVEQARAHTALHRRVWARSSLLPLMGMHGAARRVAKRLNNKRPHRVGPFALLHKCLHTLWERLKPRKLN